MEKLLTNWKTTLTGVIIIALGAANTFLGIHIPGFSLDFGSAFVMGVGLLTAKDINVTGGSVSQ